MTREDAIKILKEEKARYEYNLNGSPSAEYIGQAAKDIFDSRIKACKYAIEALELIGNIVDRPCDACEYREESGCTQESCVFDIFLYGERYGKE